MKFCKDCVHIRKSAIVPQDLSFARCARMLFKAGKISPVDGSQEPDEFLFCSTARQDDGRCGADGRYFEAEQRPVVFPEDFDPPAETQEYTEAELDEMERLSKCNGTPHEL